MVIAITAQATHDNINRRTTGRHWTVTEQNYVCCLYDNKPWIGLMEDMSMETPISISCILIGQLNYSIGLEMRTNVGLTRTSFATLTNHLSQFPHTHVEHQQPRHCQNNTTTSKVETVTCYMIKPCKLMNDVK